MEPSTTQTQRWTVGDVTITSVVEDQTDGVPPELFFPDATADSVKRHAWLVPDYADDRGHVSLRVQALVIEDGDRRILVDPCVGNGKIRDLPWWNQQSWPFMERLLDAGFKPGSIDQVLHTHLHADHLGWDTHLEDGVWVPTFVNARHLYTGAGLDHSRRESTLAAEGGQDIYADSVAPIVEAGLADVVAEDAQLGGRLRLEPTGGHSPGHVSLWIESDGETALITGDVIHPPSRRPTGTRRGGLAVRSGSGMKSNP
ncbi:MAG TPA: MBL fold metallo-hydrolase [Acidimicrobiales bacterium]